MVSRELNNSTNGIVIEPTEKAKVRLKRPLFFNLSVFNSAQIVL